MSQAIQELVHEVMVGGQETEQLTDWPSMQLRGIVVATESDARYMIEPGQPSLITRISEVTPYLDGYRLPTDTGAIIRREGNPDRDLKIGVAMNVLGLPIRGTEFDRTLYIQLPPWLKFTTFSNI